MENDVVVVAPALVSRMHQPVALAAIFRLGSRQYTLAGPVTDLNDNPPLDEVALVVQQDTPTDRIRLRHLKRKSHRRLSHCPV
jgi:hypothetical protein